MKRLYSKILIGLSLVTYIPVIFLAFLLFFHNIMPLKLRITLILLLLILNTLLYIWGNAKTNSQKLKILGILLSVVLMFSTATAIRYVHTFISTLNTISLDSKEIENSMLNTSSNEEHKISIVVLKNSKIDSIDELTDMTLGVSQSPYKDTLLAQLDTQNNIKNINNYDSDDDLVKDLYSKKVQAIIIDEEDRDNILKSFEDFNDKTRVLKTFDIDHAYETVAKNVDVKDAKAPFNLYISGIDKYGKIASVSRTDVNILATINPSTRKILLTSIPRDSYVRIAGGGKNQKDKLTHSGNYGINSSIQTLENLLDTTINYYVRLNFSSFIKIIDVLGGIEIENSTTFNTWDGKKFRAGNLKLSGEDALSFVRERKHLGEGDYGREGHQEDMIEAVLHKLIGPASLTNFQGIMKSISDSIQTNMPSSKMLQLVNQQLDEGGNWTIEKNLINGHGEMGLHSYAMPNARLWFHVIDPSSLKEAKARIKDALNKK